MGTQTLSSIMIVSLHRFMRGPTWPRAGLFSCRPFEDTNKAIPKHEAQRKARQRNRFAISMRCIPLLGPKAPGKLGRMFNMGLLLETGRPTVKMGHLVKEENR